MDRETVKKLLVTSILLVVIDRIEFAYYPFQGSEVYVNFLVYETPMQISWYVYLLSILIQHFLFTLILWMWLPLKEDFKWVVFAFATCIVEFPINYGQPLVQLPLPWQWYFPVSCSLLRLFSILYYLTKVTMKALER